MSMSTPSVEQQNDLWVFLSHSNEDYDRVRILRNLLEEYNFRPIMFFLKCLNDNEEVDHLIKREIDCRTRFILCDSDNARNSTWVQREVDYIKEQQRSYYTVDITKSRDALEEDIKKFSSDATIFISAPRETWAFARALVRRLRKYDFNVFFDDYSPMCNAQFKNSIATQIAKAKSYGLFVSLVTKATFDPKRGSYQELEIALKNGNRIVPILGSKDLPDCSKLELLKTMEYVDVSESGNSLEEALRHILTITHQPGSILTLAENFLNSDTPQKETAETDLCGRIVLEASEKQPSNHSLKFLKGKCYELGLGTPKDLEKAYGCYTEAYRMGHIESAKKGMQRLSKVLGDI